MSAAQVCVLHDKRDVPWSDWVTEQLSSAGVQVHHQLTTDPDVFTGERLIVLDSWDLGRYIWALACWASRYTHRWCPAVRHLATLFAFLHMAS
jgi:hypothetical protein